MPAAVGCEARLTADPTAVGGQLGPRPADPAAIRCELRAATDPGTSGRQLGSSTHPRAIGRELRGATPDPRAVGGKACLRADEGGGRKHEGGGEGAHGDRDDTARRCGATSERKPGPTRTGPGFGGK